MKELKASKPKIAKPKNKQFGHIIAGWRTIGGIKAYFRSKYEANWARYLQWRKQGGVIKDWLHEPETFWFLKIMRGVRSYKPDFKVIHYDGTHEWYEVKGHYDSKSLTKIKRFNKYYSQEKITLIDSKWFQKNNKNMRLLIRDWE